MIACSWAILARTNQNCLEAAPSAVLHSWSLAILTKSQRWKAALNLLLSTGTQHMFTCIWPQETYFFLVFFEVEFSKSSAAD